MATNLPPELLALLQSQKVGNTGSYMGDQFGSSHYAPIYGQGSMDGGGAEGGNWTQGPVTGYYGTENGKGNKWSDQYNGKDRQEYDAQGSYVGTDQWSGLSGGQEMLPLMMLAAPLAMMAMGVGAAGAGAAGATGGGAAGTAAELALAGEGAFGATNALGGAGAFGPAGTAYYTGTGALGAAGAGGGTGFGTLPAVEVPTWSAAEFAGSQPFNWAPAAAKAGMGLLGPALTLAAGVAGAQDQPGQTTSTVKDIPEELKPFRTQLLNYSGGLLDKQMANGYTQGYEDMRTVGQGLLNRPITGNPFTTGNMPKFGSNLLAQMYPQFAKP